MTAPAVGSQTLPVTYTVDGLVLGRHDAHGCWWIPQSTEGWHEPAAPRTRRENRPNGHGAFRSVAYREARVITIEGIVYCPDVSARLEARDRFDALCSDPGRLYEFVADDQGDRSRTAMVELDAAPKFKVRNERRADFQLQFAAPDPRKHDYAWQEPRCRPPQPTAGGLSFPLNFGGGGLDFGSPQSESTVAQVGNYGTAPAHPLFTLEGPLSSPAVLARESGRALRYGTDLTPGETLWINCDDFTQRDIPAHAAISSVRGNVGSLLVREGRDWPVIPPQGVGSFALRGYGDPSASLLVSLRSAWW